MLQDQTLLAELDRAGYFPQIVADVLEIALAGEPATAFYVHRDVAFGPGTIGQHLTVMVITPTRLITTHVDDHAADESAPAAVAASTEAVALKRIESVTLTHLTAEPESHDPSEPPSAVRLSIDWGSHQLIDLEPSECGDPDCITDHGYSGAINAENLGLQVTTEVSGAELAIKLMEFARCLYAATADAA
ncbi:MAG: DUF5998 family protein [Bifidobacteriaceae bacterium]|jgi:hypothetical protein|nr:DUF5998 family protein [Bifidobacteriaceae bacterium]